MICAQCTEQVEAHWEHCPHCGEEPRLEGRYALIRVVGHGANGTTYQATRLSDGRVVAIKELVIRKVESLKAIELFEREARVLKELRHPGIPEFLEDLNVDAGRSVVLYLVQEFIDGETLQSQFEKQRADAESVFGLAADLLDVLAYLHELRPPVIHRDIKPNNIMRRENGQLVLIDFGSVREALDIEGGSTVAGTFGFMAPEQFGGNAEPASDIYAVGATIVSLLSGEDPHAFISPPHNQINWRGKIGVPPQLAPILERMLALDPKQRPQDAAELARQIRAVLAGDVVLVPSSPNPIGLRPVPPAPRELPSGFSKTYAPSSRFWILFGSIFAGSGILSAGIPVVVGIATGEIWTFLMSLLFFAIFGGIGFISLAVGLKKLSVSKRAYRDGAAIGAIIDDIGTSSYQVNGRSANVYHYSFEANGRVFEGEYHSMKSLDLFEGDAVNVLYVESDPAVNVLHDPKQFTRRRQPRARTSNVVMDFGANTAQTAKHEPQEQSQRW